MKSFILSITLFFPIFAQAAFEGTGIPKAVYHIACDGAPRIVVSFKDGVESVWYPANGAYADHFLSVALSAQASSSEFYYFGNGTNASTAYCVSRGEAREVSLFGVQ